MYKLGILGVGKMGYSILSGIINSNLYIKDDILLCLHSNESYNKYKNEGFNVTLNPNDIFNESQIILLAVKPQTFEDVLKDSANYNCDNKCIISIAAGISISYLESKFKNACIVRAMPNIPALINMGVTTACSNKSDNSFVESAIKILESIGKVYLIAEDQMNATLPLNGSMPAYLYAFANEFIKSAVNSGIDYETSKALCVESIISSANMILKSNDSIDTLINNVCSKGGTTIAGLDKMYDNSFDKAIEECYLACMNRAFELNKK